MNSLLFPFILIIILSCGHQPKEKLHFSEKKVVVGAERMDEYLPLLKNKNVGLIVNHTSVIGRSHLIDTLISLNIKIDKIFTPEHGFRGDKDAGEKYKSNEKLKDQITLISLYGSKYKPDPKDLSDIDILVFDIQDVGVRFYTYISTLHYMMEAAAENHIPLLVLDRPNPNAHYVDGPVLKDKFKSFVGLHPIPIVYGLTIGELAHMINEEKWLKDGVKCDLTVIELKDYNRSDVYDLPIKPSPNLPNALSIQLYPSLCLFEGTLVSMGRGTSYPFQVIGYPDSTLGSFHFTPKPIDGMSKNPKLKDKKCYGIDFRNISSTDLAEFDHQISLKYLISFYKRLNTSDFFNPYFDKLAGTDQLRTQIEAGWTEKEIKVSWEKDLKAYRSLRKKYILYAD